MATIEIEIDTLAPIAVDFRDGQLVVSLADGRRIGTPLEWYPRLSVANDHERRQVEFTPLGLHWPALDEDLSIAGMLAGQRARSVTAS